MKRTRENMGPCGICRAPAGADCVDLGTGRSMGSGLHAYGNRWAHLAPGKAPKASTLPRTGAACSCRPGIERDNCAQCEGTGRAIDWQAFHAAKRRENDAASNARPLRAKGAPE